MLKLHEENPSRFEWLSNTKSMSDDSDFEFVGSGIIPHQTTL